jgi:ribosomal-protein-alanine N-acetyltransferase
MLDVSTAPILTPRLKLEPLRPAHAPAMWEVLRDPALYQWIARPPPGSQEELAARFARIAQRSAPGRAEQWLNWTVWTLDAEEAIGIVEASATPANMVHIAYIFASRVWGNGYASEATAAAIDAMSRGGATAFEAALDTRNAASRALAQRLGFRHSETRASADIIAGAASSEEMWRRDVG